MRVRMNDLFPPRITYTLINETKKNSFNLKNF